MTSIFFKRDLAMCYTTLYIPVRRVTYDILYITQSNGYMFEDECRAGDMRCVLLSIDRGEYDLEYGMYGACEGGHISIINRLLEEYKDLPFAPEWNNALLYACRRGRRDIVDLVVSHGANNWDSGFPGACMVKQRRFNQFNDTTRGKYLGARFILGM